MNKQTIIIITLILIILVGALYFFVYPKIANAIYTTGYNQGQLNLVYEINQKGTIPVIITNNQTGNQSIQMIGIKEICGGGK